MRMITSLAKYTKGVNPRVEKFCKDYVEDFDNNNDSHFAQDGYIHKLHSALLASSYLDNFYRLQNQPDKSKAYLAKVKEYQKEHRKLKYGAQW